MSQTLSYYTFKIPEFSKIRLGLQQDQLCSLMMGPDLDDTPETAHRSKNTQKIIDSLLKYFSGAPVDWQFPIDFLAGTPFQKKVWKALQTIPYGETRNYQQIANQIGSPKAVRAVGNANGKNPIPIIVPCHRVITSHQTLGGYSCGVEFKRKLLQLEGIFI